MLKKIFRQVDRAFLFFEEWSLFVAVCIALLTAITNVILRKTTSNFNIYWSDEIVRKVIFFTTYIGCVAAVRSREMICIDALPQMAPGLKKPLALFSQFTVLIFAGTMVYLGWQMTVMMFEDEYAKTATLQIPEFYFYAILPLMGCMMFLRTLITIRETWINKRDITGENE